MSSARAATLLLVCGCATLLTGCESTQSKNAKAQANAKALAPAESGLVVSTPNGEVKAVSTTVLTDAVGTAVAVELKNGAAAVTDVPVLITVKGPDGGELFTNGAPGIQRSLTHVATVAARGTTWWVNDQIPLTTGARDATAVVGEPEAPAAGASDPVAFKLGPVSLEEDPASGWAATGTVSHDAPADQQRVVITVIARKNDRVVAAGRGVVPRVRAGKRARFKAFFIGKPADAELTATAQPDIDTQP